MLEPADGVSVYGHWQPETPVTVIAARSLAASIEEVRCIWTDEPDGPFGRHVELVGPNDVIVMTFPWWDRADLDLAVHRPDGWAPLADRDDRCDLVQDPGRHICAACRDAQAERVV
jgi:hypothetical protein